MNEKTLKNTFHNSSDLIVKKIKNVSIYYLESLCSSNAINDFILKPLALEKTIPNLEKILAGPNTIKIKNPSDAPYYLENGFTIVCKHKSIYAIETKAQIIRSVATPETQQSIYGPKDAFTENIQTNLGLVKRRIKEENLINKDFFVGKRTKTKVSLLYIKDIADYKIIITLAERINKINIDGVIDSSSLAHLILGENKTPFPMVHLIERPDSVSSSLLDGKIAILVDNSPFAIVLPAFFSDFLNPPSDIYNKSINVNFIKIIRFLSFFITILSPAIYVALINYNQETIPLALLINFATQRDGVPFPAPIEALIMLILCEILRESDLRFPSNYGSSISILGALILGDAAVNAGIVSPIMIIVIAITFITGLIFNEFEMVNSTRIFRFIFLIMASFFGLYGTTIMVILLFLHLASLKPLDISYTYPLAPFDKNYFCETVYKSPIKKDKFRSRLFAKKNIRRQGDES